MKFAFHKRLILKEMFLVDQTSKNQTASPIKKSGSKLPHSTRSSLENKVYHKLKECQEKVEGMKR
jgi:hypothetical protein